MRISLQNINGINNADMDLNGLSILLTNDRIPKNFIGEAVFDSDYMLSQYINKLYEHRILIIVETCMETGTSLSSMNKLYLFNKMNRVLKRKMKLYDVLEEEINETLKLLEEILQSRKSIANQIDIKRFLTTIRQLLYSNLKQTFYEVVKRKIETELLHEFDWHNKNMRIEFVDGRSRAEFVFENNECVTLRLSKNTHAVMNLESLSICDILLEGYKEEYSFSEKQLIERVIKGRYLSDEDTVTIINDVKDRNHLEVYGINEEVVNKFYNILDSVMEIIEKTEDKYQLVCNYLNKSIDLQEVPEDLRCFVDFKILLEHYFFCSYRWAKPKIVIFAEPKSYLNDDWQDLYAEFIVLLQKYIINQVIIRTEDSNLIDKIAYYAELHGTKTGFNVYEAMQENNKFNITKLVL